MPASAAPARPNSSLWAPAGPARTAVILLILVTAIFRLIEAGVMDLILGEAYYLASTRTPHLSYFDQPPLFLWMVWATKSLFHTELPLVLRLPFVLMFSGTTWLIYRLGARFRSEWAGFFAALVMNISILFTLSIGTWLQPEAPLMLFWLFTVWALADIFFPADGKVPEGNEALKRWAIVGLWLGLTFLSKYFAVFLVIGAALYALTAKPARRWIVHPGPYLAILIAAIIGLPVLLWNMTNDWASFDFQGGRAFGSALHLDWLLRMILGQLVYIAPWIVFPALIALVLALLRGPGGRFPDDTEKGFGWFFAMMGITPIVFFTAVAAWSDTQFHFHWQAVGYLETFLLLGAWIDKAWPRHARLNRIWLTSSAVLSFLVMAVLVSHVTTGWLRYVLPNGKTFTDPTVTALGWHDLGPQFDKLRLGEQKNVFVAGMNWISCGEIDTPLAGRAPLACLSADPRNLAFNTPLHDLVGDTAYIVDPHADAKEMKKRFATFFDGFTPIATIDIHRNGFPEIRGVHIVKATDFHLGQTLDPRGAGTVGATRLPRTHIVALSGTASLAPGETARLTIDGRTVGTLTGAEQGKTSFDIKVTDDPRPVGMNRAKIVIEAQAGDQKAGFATLKVQLN